MTEAQKQRILKDIIIKVDTREQVNDHIIKVFKENDIDYFVQKLNVGDYSVIVNGKDLSNVVAIERKHNLDEICANFTSQRERFEREFERAKEAGTKVYLLIENGSMDDIYVHNYRSKLTQKAFVASLFTWLCRYNVTLLFCNKLNTAKLIHGILYYYAREDLNSYGDG